MDPMLQHHQQQTSSTHSSNANSTSTQNPQQQQSKPHNSLHQTLQKQRRPLSYQQPSYSDSKTSRASTASPQRQAPTPLLGRFTEEWEVSQRGSSILEDYRGHMAGSITSSGAMQRANSTNSYAAGDDHQLPARGNTLKKKASLRRTSSLGRSSSRRSNKAGSVKSLVMQSASNSDELHSVFYCPVPTKGSPTDVLVNRFQTWRKILKDLISYYREIQSHYEQKSKSFAKIANVTNSISTPPSFLETAGIDDALQFLRNYNKSAIQEANKAKEIEEDVILALTGLRSDLQQKIKEIKHLSGDFKNSVEKEMEGTARAVKALSEVLNKNETDASSTTGKQDPYLLKLAVDRQIERQLDEENYLHQAYLNIEGSGRELESIIVGEIQKAYNAYAGILKREADNAYHVVGELRDGPISMPKDQEWIHFVTNDDRVVDPNLPLRSTEHIHYPGQDHVSAQEIRAGLLERKSKYLKSYTAGWYVLSTTHLHEFKSADKVQPSAMSLYLPEQKLGSHSSEEGSSNKFVLKGRQTGSMHRGHTWVFRAESHDTMLAWYEDIKALTEKSPEERTEFVRSHSRRSMSRSSRRSASSDLLDEEDDEEPFAATAAQVNADLRPDPASRRPQPGGRFPSDIQVNAERGLQVPHSPSSMSSSQEHAADAQVIAEATALPGAVTVAYSTESHEPEGGKYLPYGNGSEASRIQMPGAPTISSIDIPEQHLDYGRNGQTPIEDVPSQAAIASRQAPFDGVNPYTSEPLDQEPVGSQTTDPRQSSGMYMTPAMIQEVHSESNPTTIDGDKKQVNQKLNQHAMHENGTFAGGSPLSVDSSDLNGGNYTNIPKADSDGHDTEAPHPATIPRSEFHSNTLGSQGSFGQHLADQTTENQTITLDSNITHSIPKSQSVRTNSVVTVSGLSMPGSFPTPSLSSP